MMPSPAVAKLSSAFIGIMRSLHCERGQPLHLLPSSQHPLLPLPIDTVADTSSHVPLAPSEIQKTFLESGITKIAFIRHGNTSPASNDFERTLTELGRSQSRAAGASYGIDLYPFSNVALCSSAPRCVETANLFLGSAAETMQQDDVGDYAMPKLSLQEQMYDGTMQPEGSRLFAKIGYAPIRSYLENENLDDVEAARIVLGNYARSSLDIMVGATTKERRHNASTDTDIGRTLLFFAHAVYLPSAALCLAAALDCYNGMDLILDTNTKEAEGYCIDIDKENVSLLCRPKT
ncbi:hypothetical protein QTG54_010400 [Skeletonema marinoi]|uniref:Uncharacterized protein n=1 Tax=Skeletonema marinoi TaxID=267567 RepID=A0AAD8Y4U3_9STRA|nr:hypothetical protein QTG54_010400 [Skeletonema marinoi]